LAGAAKPITWGLPTIASFSGRGLDDSKIYVFDVGTNPSKPKLIRTIADLPAKTKFVGPHDFYALPGRMLIGNLSNTIDKSGVTGWPVQQQGSLIAKYDMPSTSIGGVKVTGMATASRSIRPRTCSDFEFFRLAELMRGWGIDQGSEAMKHFGNTVVVWNLKSMQPTQILSVTGAPLEIRGRSRPARTGRSRQRIDLEAVAHQAG